MVKNERGLVDPMPREVIEQILDDRSVGDGEERGWPLESQGTEPPSPPARQNDSLHRAPADPRLGTTSAPGGQGPPTSTM